MLPVLGASFAFFLVSQPYYSTNPPLLNFLPCRAAAPGIIRHYIRPPKKTMNPNIIAAKWPNNK